MKSRHFLILLVAFFSIQSFAESLPPELMEIQKKLHTESYKNFVSDVRHVRGEAEMGAQPLPPPPFEEKLKRVDWIEQFAKWTAEQRKFDEAKKSEFMKATTEMFTSYYRDEPYARVPFLKVYEGGTGSAAILKTEKILLPATYPGNHSLDVARYVADRFPEELQSFFINQKVSLYFDDSNVADAFAYQKSKGYSKAFQFMGSRDNADTPFLIVENPIKKTYRFVVTDLHGEDAKTRLVAILGPLFRDREATRIYHEDPSPLLDFNEAGKKFVFDSKKDRVVMGFLNTVWWQLKTSGEPWTRTTLTKSGTEVSLFENSKTRQRIVGVANLYGDEMKEALKDLYERGARRWVYLGTAGGLADDLQLGDLLLPKKFLKPDGKWFEFENDAEKMRIPKASSSKLYSRSLQGWVATLIEETKEFLINLKKTGAQALDVESRYFAEFLNAHPVEEKTLILVVSDQPLGQSKYDKENATRALPMKNINELVPMFVLSAILKYELRDHLPASVEPGSP